MKAKFLYPTTIVNVGLPSREDLWILCPVGESCCPFLHDLYCFMGLPGGSDGKESACNAGDSGSFPGSGGSTGKGNGYPLQYSCLENSMDRGA